MISIILVHIGPDFFDYINDCINQIRKFNDCNIYLVIEEKHKLNIEDKEVILVYYENLLNSEKYFFFKKTNNLDKNFRNGFWTFATERFFALEETMKLFKLENVFHIENDNLIFFDIKSKIDVFEKHYHIASVFDNDQRCIPSFVYIKNIQSISNLTDFILKNPNSNDMELLSLYKQQGGNIKNLPIIPSYLENLEFKSQTGNITIDKKQYSHLFEEFESVFDGAAIGQFLGGVDPRNQSGITEGFINETTIFNVSEFNFFYEIDNNERKTYFMQRDNKKIKINNLHLHCKNLKKFM